MSPHLVQSSLHHLSWSETHKHMWQVLLDFVPVGEEARRVNHVIYLQGRVSHNPYEAVEWVFEAVVRSEAPFERWSCRSYMPKTTLEMVLASDWGFDHSFIFTQSSVQFPVRWFSWEELIVRNLDSLSTELSLHISEIWNLASVDGFNVFPCPFSSRILQSDEGP